MIEHTYRYAKRPGEGWGEFAQVTLLVALEEPGTGVTFQEQTTPNRVEAKYIDGVEEGVRQALAAAKCADATVFLRDYIFLDVAKTVNAFRMAGKLCVEEALTRL